MDIDKKKEHAQILADHLLGTCTVLEVAFDACGTPEELQDDTEFLLELDDKVSECTQCGWWVETHDTDIVDSQIVCTECIAEDEEE